MMILESYWMSKDEWIHQKPNGQYEINKDAPEEAQKSYQKYLEQRAEVKAYLKEHPGYM